MLNVEVVLANAKDILYAEDGNLPKQKIRQVSTLLRVDSDNPLLSISQELKIKLGLKEKRKLSVQLPSGEVQELSVVGPIEVYFQKQSCTVDALVLPAGFEQILGTISMQYMNLVLNTKKNELVLKGKYYKI